LSNILEKIVEVRIENHLTEEQLTWATPASIQKVSFHGNSSI